MSQSKLNYFEIAVESTFTLSATTAESTLTVSTFVESTSSDAFVAELLQEVAKLSAAIAATKNKIFFIVIKKKILLIIIMPSLKRLRKGTTFISNIQIISIKIVSF